MFHPNIGNILTHLNKHTVFGYLGSPNKDKIINNAHEMTYKSVTESEEEPCPVLVQALYYLPTFHNAFFHRGSLKS